MVVGEDAPPMHPFCRCSVAAAMPDEEFKELTGVDQVKLNLKAITRQQWRSTRQRAIMRKRFYEISKTKPVL